MTVNDATAGKINCCHSCLSHHLQAPFIRQRKWSLLAGTCNLSVPLKHRASLTCLCFSDEVSCVFPLGPSNLHSIFKYSPDVKQIKISSHLAFKYFVIPVSNIMLKILT